MTKPRGLGRGLDALLGGEEPAAKDALASARRQRNSPGAVSTAQPDG